MIQIVAAAAVGAVGLYAYRELRRHLDRLEEEDAAKKRAEELRKNDDAPALELDPETGKYRIRK
ncbi:MAG: hypothetical protein AAF764_09990 [Pseudomonadota bacterium]